MKPSVSAAIVILLAVLGAAAGFSTNALEGGLVGLTAGGLLGVILIAGITAMKQLSGSSLLFAAGLGVLFLGERMLASGTERLVVSGLGAVIVAMAVGIRLYAMSQSGGRLKAAHQLALGASGIALFGLLLYVGTLEPVARAFFTDDEVLHRWGGTLAALWPIAILCGLLPLIAVDRVIALHPKVIPPRAAREVAVQALSAALAIALIFPVNYLASKNEWSSDVAYFRTTRAGESSLAIARALTEPVEVTLFFPAGSDVGAEVGPYFDSLAAESDGLLKVTMVDQALAPALSEELKVRDNGFVAMKMGESLEKFKIGDELDKAKRNLRKLDETAQKHLLKVTRGQRNAYFVVGHGEGNFRERENLLRKMMLFKKVLESQNYKVSNLGPAEGLGNTVPSDADLVILSSPEKPLAPEEVQSLNTYLDEGGALLVMADPGDDPLTDLLATMGLSVGQSMIAHAQAHISQTRGRGDRILLATNRFGSHESVRTLSKNGTTMSVILPTAGKIVKTEKAGVKVHTLIRSFPDSWEDVNNNREKDGNEPGEVFDLAVAATGPDLADGKSGWRAMVIGDMGWASDPAIQSSQGNQVFLLDGVRWLVGDEDISGEVSSEEDVKIQHTRGQDWVWFYLTVLAVPLLVFGLGATSIRLRGRNA